jgi:hypothetical protein
VIIAIMAKGALINQINARQRGTDVSARTDPLSLLGQPRVDIEIMHLPVGEANDAIANAVSIVRHAPMGNGA